MLNERTANELLQDYAAKEWEQRQAWVKVLGSSPERNSKLTVPVKPTQRKVVKQGFFSRLFKVVYNDSN